MKNYQILLYYKFVPIENPAEYAKKHLEMCKELELKGRILINDNGINGTCSGTVENTNRYIEIMHTDARFADTWFKIDASEGHVFKKMHVRYKPELVTFRLDEVIDPNKVTGQYLNPQEWHELLQDENVVVLDGRTDYEFDLGHFRNAIRPPLYSFKEFPTWIRENLSEMKEKKILTYCTGGIRCELLTGFMIQEGFKDVAQLHGGIVSYGKDEMVKGSLFDGKCYVFDERISVEINHTEDKLVVAKCYHCGAPTERYLNCANMECNLQFACCEECEEKTMRSCSPKCESAPHRQALKNEFA